MGNPQIKIPNEEEEEIKIGEGVMVIIYNTISNNHMSKITTHPKDNILIWHSLKVSHKISCPNHLLMTLTGSCNKLSFTTPQQQQDSISKDSSQKANIHQIRDKRHIKETVKIQDNQSKLNTYVSYAEIKATMTINVNLQQISCKEHKKHFNALTTCMMLIMIRNGPKERIMMIINSLFNKEGSWCC